MSVPPATTPHMAIKVYVVVQPHPIATPGDRNSTVLGVKLNRSSAERLVQENAGAYIVKVHADKT